MLLIVGLGNPGPQYEGNRHNIGFKMVEAIAEAHRFSPWQMQSKFEAQVCEGQLAAPDGAKIKTILAKPQTYMNDSGRSVAAIMRKHYLQPSQIVVFHDEIDMALGRFRMATGRSAAGHNGIRSIYALASTEVRRGRMGVGHPGEKSAVKASVLADFHPDERPAVNALLKACIDALPFLVAGTNDERYQTAVMQLAPAPKSDPKKPKDA
ncbi:MAG TPA: aminoacyl-tRNA hydrolase [Hyphomonadaceae bacterium]|jgi:PTH1 family peptidyl-tRNA hydrolase|nr:aminoacyl-tRNA hydrolase [Hyphomonadaceae bacterium]